MAEDVKTREMSRSSDLEAVSPEDVPRSAEDMEGPTCILGTHEKTGKPCGSCILRCARQQHDPPQGRG